ncbi:hypothetical protein IHX65_004871 [Salmonella enterica]|nr:hypothetical protein [Salmonella enterica]
MTKKQGSIVGFLVFLSALVGYEVGLADVANFAHDEMQVIRKNLDKSCTYAIHQEMLFALCNKNIVINQ